MSLPSFMCARKISQRLSDMKGKTSHEQSFHFCFVELHDNFTDFLSWRESDTVDGQSAMTDGAVHSIQTAAGPSRAESGGGKRP